MRVRECELMNASLLVYTYLLVEERGELGRRGDRSLFLFLLRIGGQSGRTRHDRLSGLTLLVLLREGVRAIATTALSNHLSHFELRSWRSEWGE